MKAIELKTEGDRLRAWMQVSGIADTVMAEKLGVHHNTIGNWKKRDTLNDVDIVRIAQHYPSVRDVFPDVAYEAFGPIMVAEPEVEYSTAFSNACKAEIDRWKQKYHRILEAHNELLTRHIEALNELHALRP